MTSSLVKQVSSGLAKRGKVKVGQKNTFQVWPKKATSSLAQKEQFPFGQTDEFKFGPKR